MRDRKVQDQFTVVTYILILCFAEQMGRAWGGHEVQSCLDKSINCKIVTDPHHIL